MTHQTMVAHTGVGDDMEMCIEVCQECHATCLHTIMHCLSMGGAHATAAHIGLLLDCADACRLSADFMLRGSPRHTLTCSTCAELCEACAVECDRFPDEFMKECAMACRRCAASCREMAAGA